MACKAKCQEKGNRYCCLECPDNDTCKMQCDHKDAVEYAKECTEYYKEMGRIYDVGV